MNEQTTEARQRFSKRWFEGAEGLAGQEGWYDQKASTNKSWHTWLGFIIVAAGALTAVIQLWAPQEPDRPVHWVAIVTAFLGALVVIAKGIERIWNYDANWAGYRRASEALRRERRLFHFGAGPYAATESEDASERLFVERCEEIIASEQEGFWGTGEAE